ncbi:hypothetical protein CXB51_006503 [Gossypium anomalum]|uniref:Leucine-rich repeat-containing N-terminal plant-type domain-containing protein n=1 Tax=Gossypium anomalum TaxID=47600 RepID=A0A8J5Z3N9_9ROSI|nr:hypothetical protein CXB51_006503 [Gossypium anomalum]
METTHLCINKLYAKHNPPSHPPNMTTLHSLISLFLFSCFLPLLLSFSPPQTHLPMQCLDDQRSPLLQLQRHLYYAPHFTFSSKFELWDVNTDCCSWEGLTCDAYGHVVGIDLSYKNLSGSFHSIFNLHHLQHLNLAGNNFNTTLFSYGFDKLQNLTHLNLSSSCFHGQIPMKISHLTSISEARETKLQNIYQEFKVSQEALLTTSCYLRYCTILDPYHGRYNCYELHPELEQPLKLEKPNFKTLIKNLRFLTELYLDGVDISTQSAKWCETTSFVLSNLRVLSLSYCGLKGPLCSSLSRLSFLSKLILDGNTISYLPPNFLEISSHLVSLSLRSCNLSGHFPTEILLSPKIQSIDISINDFLNGRLPEFSSTDGKLPESIGNLKFLTDLDLYGCNFFGPIPLSIANLSHLVNLDLGGNMLSGSIHSSLFTLPSLKTLYLGENQLVGKIDDFPNASSSFIEELYIGNNYLTGPIPKSVLQLPWLEWLYIESLSFMKLDMSLRLNNLRDLTLFNTSLLIESDNRNLTFPQLERLSLRLCNLTEFPEFIKRQDKLVELDLSNNHIHGFVPNWLWKTNLSRVDLSFNMIDFPKQLPLSDANFSFPMLKELYLASCNISSFPEFIKTQDKLVDLDLSNNHIHGVVPNWLWKSSLSRVNLSFNVIDFPKQLPLSDLNFSFSMLRELYLESCNISSFPEFLKSQENLEYLELSNNKMSGAIPNWVWKKNLRHLSLANNHLSSLDQLLPNQSSTSSQGPFTFYAAYNNLSGPIPNWLCNMSQLDTFDNRLEGKLPRSLAKCTQLMVLDVGSNMINDTFPFWLKKLTYLMVLILRENRFYGQMKHFKHKSVFPTLDVLDIASNQFSGELSIDFLQVTRLRSLKIGGNKLEGKLSRSLANCTALEVLDLGNNMVYDTFPFWLEKPPSLKVLVLRANRFYGTIKKFDTKHGFPKLRILDIASNNFSGDLSIEFLQSLKAMAKMTNDEKAKLDYIGENYYQDSVTIDMKCPVRRGTDAATPTLCSSKETLALDVINHVLGFRSGCKGWTCWFGF